MNQTFFTSAEYDGSPRRFGLVQSSNNDGKMFYSSMTANNGSGSHNMPQPIVSQPAKPGYPHVSI